MSAGNEHHDELGTVARRLDHLFQTVHPAGEKPYTYRGAAAKINELAGHNVISAPYLQQIRSGKRPSPAHEKLAWIAAFFGVPVAYFSQDEVAKRVDQQLRAVTEWRDAGLDAYRLLATGLSPAAQEQAKEYLRDARRREGLPEILE
ncbi:helix-turn-helix domain-containing protein [Longispora sp. NPDC051575]|uniref:helix-turn-helix domain-containing protein n=1 Tax=Longispora sp. NPDC051575 TaxID=3154943 RepID=UPI003445F629